MKSLTVMFAAAISACFSFPATSNAAVITASGDITQIITYTRYANRGDSLIQLNVSLPPECDGGGWLNAGDPGYQASLSKALSFYLAGKPVRIFMDNADTFPGSSLNYCRIESIWTN